MPVEYLLEAWKNWEFAKDGETPSSLQMLALKYAHCAATISIAESLAELLDLEKERRL